MTIKVFGHTSPDTDSTGSALIWAWYLSNVRDTPATACLLGEPNTEAAFVLRRWGFQTPRIIEAVDEGDPVVIVDTNNPAELPDNIHTAEILAIIDHHQLTGGLRTRQPIDVTMRAVACTATVMHELMGDDAGRMPDGIKGLMLSCILSDTLGFRSPTTTGRDRELGEGIAAELGLSIQDYAAELFAAKSDTSAFSDAQLLRMDSKRYEIGGTRLRISVLETTSPQTVLTRKASLMRAMSTVAQEDDVDHVLLFVIDILSEQSTLLVPDAFVKNLAEKSFDVTVDDDTVRLPGVVSRKKQIMPSLKV